MQAPSVPDERGQRPAADLIACADPSRPATQLLRCQQRPQPVQRGADPWLVPEPFPGVGHVLLVERAVEHPGLGPGQLGEQLGDEQLAGHVVRPAQRPGAVAGAQDRGAAQRDASAVGVDGQVLPWHPLPVADRLAQDPDHPLVALDDRGGVPGVRRVHAGKQVAEGVQHHVGLAEAGQHLADVAEERGVRADDEDAAALERAAVRVEQVGGAVQRGDRLSGAGAALDDEHAGQVRPDHAVLLGLDGGHHVGHPAGAGAADRGDQRGLAGQVQPVGVGELVEVEHLVVEAGDRAAPGVDVAAADQAFRVARRGGVEGARRGGAPVDQLQVVIVVAQADAADVQRGLVLVVGAAEAQPAFGVG